jgi:hypothetical protein
VAEKMKKVDKLIREIKRNREEILETFARAYLAETGLKPSEVVMCIQDGGGFQKIWFARQNEAYLNSPLVAGRLKLKQ